MFQCINCGLTFKYKYELASHHCGQGQSSAPTYQPSLKCDTCGNIVNDLTKHKASHLDQKDRSFMCQLHGTTFAVASLVYPHLKSNKHQNNNQYDIYCRPCSTLITGNSFDECEKNFSKHVNDRSNHQKKNRYWIEDHQPQNLNSNNSSLYTPSSPPTFPYLLPQTHPNENVLCLCLDIDNTLIYPNRSFFDAFAVSGENGNVDLRNVTHGIPQVKWYVLLQHIQQICSQFSVQLDVHLICSKFGRRPDKIVDVAITLLYPFLELLPGKNTANCDNIIMPSQYFFRSYSYMEEKNYWTLNFLFNHKQNEPTSSPLYEELLHKLHMVCNNKRSEKATDDDINQFDESYLFQNNLISTSKALVMQSIEKKLKQLGKNPIGMILVDDTLNPNMQEVASCGYHFIHADQKRDISEVMSTIVSTVKIYVARSDK